MIVNKHSLTSAADAQKILMQKKDNNWYANFNNNQIEALGNLPLILLNHKEVIKKMQEIKDEILKLSFGEEKFTLINPESWYTLGCSSATHFPLSIVNNNIVYNIFRKKNSYEVYCKNIFIFSYVHSKKCFKMGLDYHKDCYMDASEIEKLIKTYISCVNFL